MFCGRLTKSFSAAEQSRFLSNSNVTLSSSSSGFPISNQLERSFSTYSLNKLPQAVRRRECPFFQYSSTYLPIYIHLSLSPSLFLSLSPTHTLSLSHTLSHTHTLSLTHTHSLTLSTNHNCLDYNYCCKVVEREILS